jgi:predicted nucleic acid-binding protein
VNYLLDTCMISELVRPAPDARVLEWISSAEESALYLSVLTIGELEKRHRAPAIVCAAPEIERWVREDLADRFAGRVLAVDTAVAEKWGQISGASEARGTAAAGDRRADRRHRPRARPGRRDAQRFGSRTLRRPLPESMGVRPDQPDPFFSPAA